jgi:hypothetical protein
MTIDNRIVMAVSAVIFGAGFIAGGAIQPWGGSVQAQSANRVFELRTYTAPDGKLNDLHARFRNHTLKLFAKHGITNVGYFKPLDAPLSQNTMVYLLAYPSRDAAKQSWDAFRKDADWVKARAESEAKGPIVSNVQSVFLEPADYSPMK